MDGVPDTMQEEKEKVYDVEAIKSRLVDFRERERDIDNQIERLDSIETRLSSVGSPTISDMPKSPSPVQDRMASMMAVKIDLENDIRKAVQFQDEERKFFEKVLSYLKHSDEKAVIRMRYLDGSTWYDVTDMMIGGKADYLGKEETYLRRVHKVHGAALLNMAIVIEDKLSVGDNSTNC